MLRIGSRIGFDCSGRIIVPMELAEMLNLSRGEDLVYWAVEDGKAVLHKATQPLYGIDIESEEIEANLRDYERRNLICPSFSGLSEEERRKRAIEEYERRKGLRRPSSGRQSTG